MCVCSGVSPHLYEWRSVQYPHTLSLSTRLHRTPLPIPTSDSSFSRQQAACLHPAGAHLFHTTCFTDLYVNEKNQILFFPVAILIPNRQTDMRESDVIERILWMHLMSLKGFVRSWCFYINIWPRINESPRVCQSQVAQVGGSRWHRHTLCSLCKALDITLLKVIGAQVIFTFHLTELWSHSHTFIPMN